MKTLRIHQWGQCMQMILKFTALVVSAVSGMAYAHPADALPDAHVRAYKEQLIEQIKEKKSTKSIPDISDEQARAILKKTYDLRENIALLYETFNGRISLTYVDETDARQPILKIKMKNASHQDVNVVRNIIKSNHFEITSSFYSGSEIDEISSIISDGIKKRPDLTGKIFDYSFDPIDEMFVIETIDGKREFIAKFLKSISMENIPYQVKKVAPSVDRRAKPIVSGGIPIRNGTGGPNCPHLDSM